MPKYPYNTTSRSKSAAVFWISPYYCFYNKKFQRSTYYSLCPNILYNKMTWSNSKIAKKFAVVDMSNFAVVPCVVVQVCRKILIIPLLGV